MPSDSEFSSLLRKRESGIGRVFPKMGEARFSQPLIRTGRDWNTRDHGSMSSTAVLPAFCVSCQCPNSRRSRPPEVRARPAGSGDRFRWPPTHRCPGFCSTAPGISASPSRMEVRRTGRVEDGVLIAGDHDIISKDWFRDAQVHVEFNLPGNDPSQGNSGLLLPRPVRSPDPGFTQPQPLPRRYSSAPHSSTSTPPWSTRPGRQASGRATTSCFGPPAWTGDRERS